MFLYIFVGGYCRICPKPSSWIRFLGTTCYTNCLCSCGFLLRIMNLRKYIYIYILYYIYIIYIHIIYIYLSWLSKRPTSLGYFGFGPVAHAGTVTQSNLSIASGKPSQQNCKHFSSEMNDLQYLDAWMLETLCFHRLMAKHQALTTVDPIPTGYTTRLFVGYQFGFVWKKSRCSGLLLITSYHGLSGLSWCIHHLQIFLLNPSLMFISSY